eukprot:7312636-Pyramimonas_sp.AAC.1
MAGRLSLSQTRTGPAHNKMGPRPPFGFSSNGKKEPPQLFGEEGQGLSRLNKRRESFKSRIRPEAE